MPRNPMGPDVVCTTARQAGAQECPSGMILAFVSGTLSWDGSAFLYDADGRVTTEQVAAIDAGMGLFAIEPWRSSRDNFNVWYTDLEPATPVEWLNTPERPFEIPDATVVTVALDAYRFNPELTSVGLELKAVIDQMREQVQNVE